VLSEPHGEHMRLRLKTLDERQFASTFSNNFDPFTNARWDWIAEQVAEQFGCRPSDVSSIDTDDELDLICVRGEPVAHLIRDYGWAALAA
jgi:hypothetical protein